MVSPTSIARLVAVAVLPIALLVAGVGGPASPVRAADPASSAWAGPLDGRTFSARIVRADSEGDDPLGDQLVFENGMFSSAICKRFNFAEAPYWVRMEGDRIQFLAELNSPTDGKMVWKGIIQDGTLEGTMHWTKERWYWTIDTEHRIRGELETQGGGAPSASN